MMFSAGQQLEYLHIECISINGLHLTGRYLGNIEQQVFSNPLINYQKGNYWFDFHVHGNNLKWKSCRRYLHSPGVENVLEHLYLCLEPGQGPGLSGEGHRLPQEKPVQPLLLSSPGLDTFYTENIWNYWSSQPPDWGVPLVISIKILAP